MSDKSNISWTDATWNPVTGCTQVSPGCAKCYAKAMTERFHGPGSFDTVVLHPERLKVPLDWKTPRRIFVNSMSDLFHEDVPDEFIDRVFAVMALTPRHTYQVLTKRPERMREYMGGRDSVRHVSMAANTNRFSWPLPNVLLGVSAENQHWADQRIPILLDTPAAGRFVSLEPLLEAVDMEPFQPFTGALNTNYRAARGILGGHLDWVIVGGESGSGRRPFDLQWARDLKAQCDAAGVAYFFKQAGGPRPGMASGDPELDAAKAWPDA